MDSARKPQSIDGSDQYLCYHQQGGLRLLGLVSQGSIPWAGVGLMALFQIALLRLAS